MSSMQQALETVAPDVAIAVRDARFNPLEFVSDQVNEERLKHGLASNLAWAVDTTIVSVCTSMYFEIARENAEKATDLNAVIDTFTGNYDHEGYWGEGNARTLVALLAVQPHVHSLAVRTAMAIGYMNYQPKSLDELVTRQSPFKVTELELTNLRAAAKFISEQEGCEETVEEIEKRLIAQRTMRAEDMAKMRRGLLPAVRTFVMEARKHLPGADEMPITYGDLPLTTRLFIARMQRDAIGRVVTDAAPRVDTSEFTAILIESNVCKKAYQRVVDKLTHDLEQERSEISYA